MASELSSPSLLVIQILLLFLLGFSLRSIYTAYFSSLSKIPSAHPSSAFSRVWLLLQKWRGYENRARFKAHKRLGPVVRLSPYELSINSIEGVHTVYNNNLFERVKWYPNAFRGWDEPFMVTMIHNKEHAARKRLMAPMYTKSFIQNSPLVVSILDKVLQDELRREIQISATKGTTVDVMLKFKAVVTDITTAWLFGIDRRTDWLRDELEAGYFYKHFNRSSKGFFWRSEFYETLSFLLKFGIRISPKFADDSHRALQEWCDSKCRASQLSRSSEGTTRDHQRVVNTTDEPHLYSKLRAGLEKTSPPSEIDTLIKNELLDHVIANQVATAIALVYISHSLSLHPHWQQKLRKELVQHSRDNENNVLSPRTLDTLPILDAIVMETLRLYSPNPGPWPRHNPTSPTQIGKYDIPPGTTISASSYTLHRNETVFPEPETWRPERWLEASEEGRAEMMRWFWAFGSGTHMCIGSHLALLSMKAIVKIIYGEFETRVVDDSGMEQLDSVIAGPKGDRLLLGFVKLSGEVEA